jgi:hypothetical protein
MRGFSVELNYPSHLGCILRIHALIGMSCPFCCDPPGFYFILNVKVEKEGQIAHLSTITDALWAKAKKEAAYTGTPATGILIRAIEGNSQMIKEEEKLTSQIKEALNENQDWDPYPILLLFSVSRGSLLVVQKLLEQPASQRVDPSIITAAASSAKRLGRKEIGDCLDLHLQKIREVDPNQTQREGEGITTPIKQVVNGLWVDGYSWANTLELACHIATTLRRWSILKVLFEEEDSNKVISSDYVRRAWLAAAAAGQSDILILINAHRPETVISYRDRIEALALYSETTRVIETIPESTYNRGQEGGLPAFLRRFAYSSEIDITQIILPSEKFSDLIDARSCKGIVQWALTHVQKSGNREKIGRVIAYTQEFYPTHLQEWLTSFRISRTLINLSILFEQKIPMSVNLKEQFLLELTERNELSLNSLKKLVSRSALPLSEETTRSVSTLNENFAPISTHSILLTLLYAVHSQDLEMITFLFSLGEFPVTDREWEQIYGAAKGEGQNPEIIALLESTYPGHAKTAREAPPVEETRFNVRRFLADRLPQGLTNFFSWIGGRLSKIWEKLNCSWTRR